MTITCGNTLQIPPKQANFKEKYNNVCCNACDIPFMVEWCVALWPMHVCRVWKVAILFSNLNFSQIEYVTTHYQILQTWIGHNATCYNNLNALSHVLPLELLYIFSLSSMVWGYLKRVTTRYHQISEKYINIILEAFTVMQPKTREIPEKIYSNACGNVFQLR